MRTLRLLLPYFKPYKKSFFVGILCGLIFGASSGLGIPILFDKVFKAIFEAPPEAVQPFKILLYALSLPLIFAVRGLTGFLNTYILNQCSMLALKDLREQLFAKLQQLQLKFFDNNASGDLINRLNQDPAAVQGVVLEVAGELFRQPLQMFFGLIGLLYLSFHYKNTVFLLLFLLALPLCLVPFKLLRSALKSYSRQYFQAASEVSETILENLAFVLEVRSFGLEESQCRKLAQKLKTDLDLNLRTIKLQKLQQPMMEVIISLFIGTVFAYAFFKGIPFSTFSAMGLCLYFTLDPAKRILNLISNLHKIQGAIERILALLTLPLDVQPAVAPVPLQHVQGTIRFEDLHFTYDKQPVFCGLNATIPAGMHCALVGPSGSGKSTLCKLLLRFYELDAGRITIDGVDIRDCSFQDLRRQIAIVSQQPTLLNTSVYQNILVGNPQAEPSAVYAAAEAAFAAGFIQQLEQGYETSVGERGNRLSVGQKQRITIARAFLKNAPILVLDEATSALDADSETYIQEALQRLAHNKTVISIAHRLSTIQKADQIWVFNQGSIIATGTHASLLANCLPYAAVVKKQHL